MTGQGWQSGGTGRQSRPSDVMDHVSIDDFGAIGKRKSRRNTAPHFGIAALAVPEISFVLMRNTGIVDFHPLLSFFW
ncbi:MAG: hypothetical protein V4733_06930 [Verrucomicrobiota bacterium]